MKLKTGNIVWFRYNRYKEDKSPIALILYGGDAHHPVHAINLNYLPDNLNEKVVDMISKIASKQLDAKDMKQLYHSYMKKRLHPIIAAGYRTYTLSEIREPKIVSYGFAESISFIHKFKTKFSKEETKQLKAVIEKKIDLGKQAKKNIETKKITAEEAEKRARQYMKLIQQITARNVDTIDFSQFTQIPKGK